MLILNSQCTRNIQTWESLLPDLRHFFCLILNHFGRSLGPMPEEIADLDVDVDEVFVVESANAGGEGRSTAWERTDSASGAG